MPDPVLEILTKQLGIEMLVKSESASLKELVNQLRCTLLPHRCLRCTTPLVFKVNHTGG